MKKLLLLCSIGLIAVSVNAQKINRVALSHTAHLASVTVTNGGADSLLVTMGNSSSLQFQALVNKLTGTAGGNVTLQGSQDGINFEPIPSLLTSGSIGMDTLKITNISGVQNHSFIIPTIHHNVYMLIYKGAGTMTCNFTSFETEVLSPVYFK